MATTKPRTTRPWTSLQRLLDLDGNWTHERLAGATGFSKPYVKLLLAGHRAPSRTVIDRFAKLLRVPKTMIEQPGTPTRYAYRLDEVGAMIGLDDTDVFALVQSGELATKLVNGNVLVTDLALTEWISAHSDADVPEQRDTEQLGGAA